ncbi:hypothetical protein ANASTE_00664 [Anaerofustis stercorihominis DSM 17244]|uniref:Uncharacterized protein n=2 Tax=Anaerofustis stercorihominis TaxID=214853 RepID=B1C7G2_9FIRM|nr:hypothetical protein ANASTE_00664 [Anaerofustis stercorihominis DSM 17244]
MDYRPQTEYVNIIHCIPLFGKKINGGIFMNNLDYIDVIIDEEHLKKLNEYCKAKNLNHETAVCKVLKDTIEKRNKFYLGNL